MGHEGGVRTDRNRNTILAEFIELGVDGVLWLDSDMVYPPDIIERYLELEKLHGEMSIIGALYFKRSAPHSPIGYTASDDPRRPYRPIMPQLIKRGTIYEVEGLGYGGMYVPMSVYEKMGEKKWTKYGENFHDPKAESGNLTHDLVFCRDAREAGIKIFLHGSVRPGHIGEKLITEEDFFDNFPPRLLKHIKVLVCMPTTDTSLAYKAIAVMQARAGYPNVNFMAIEDENRDGFIAVANNCFKEFANDYHFFVYTAQDAMVANNWLANMLLEQYKTQKPLMAFNDGKWEGSLASFGMVEVMWAKQNYDGDLFFPGYHSHYADTELTQLAKSKKEYGYAPMAIMLEVDYDKGTTGDAKLNKKDKKLYTKRIKKLVQDPFLRKQFS